MRIKWQSEKKLIVQGVKQITKLGLSSPTNGNVSIRLILQIWSRMILQLLTLMPNP